MRRIILATALLTTVSCTALVDLKPAQASGISSIGRGLGNAGSGLASGNEDKAWGWFLFSLAFGGVGIAVALNKPSFFDNMADNCKKKKNYKGAVSWYDSALSLKRDKDYYYFEIGQTYLAQGNKQKALDEYNLAIDFCSKCIPENRNITKYYAHRGAVLLDLGTIELENAMKGVINFENAEKGIADLKRYAELAFGGNGYYCEDPSLQAKEKVEALIKDIQGHIKEAKLKALKINAI